MTADTTDTGAAPEFTSTLDRIVGARRRTDDLRAPHRTDIERPPGPQRREIWRAVARGEIPSLRFFKRFTQYQPIAYVRMPRGDLYFLNDPELIWDVFVTQDTIKGCLLYTSRCV